MLTSFRIQNFRSIHDATVKLGQVNLFIGPNNSGKSNFLKGVTMFSEYLKVFPKTYKLSEEDFQIILPRESSSSVRTQDIIRFGVQTSKNSQAISGIIGYAYDYEHGDDGIAVFSQEIITTADIQTVHNFNDYFDGEHYHDNHDVPSLIWKIQKYLSNTKLHKFEPSAFVFSTALSDQPSLAANGYNITPFLYTLSQNHEANFARLRADLANCVVSLTSVSTPPDPVNKGNLRLKFFDAEGKSYWAEEVSEGVLYFLALLCIVHQPNPPKLLLIEEPEKGIHPRRIKEVMDFIFELAQLRDIQIILTSHSPYVVDHFADIPECISVFDRENGETIIHNAGDIITETNAKLIAEGKKPIRYTDALGEHWVSGFLGGVPA